MKKIDKILWWENTKRIEYLEKTYTLLSSRYKKTQFDNQELEEINQRELNQRMGTAKKMVASAGISTMGKITAPPLFGGFEITDVFDNWSNSYYNLSWGFIALEIIDMAIGLYKEDRSNIKYRFINSIIFYLPRVIKLLINKCISILKTKLGLPFWM